MALSGHSGPISISQSEGPRSVNGGGRVQSNHYYSTIISKAVETHSSGSRVACPGSASGNASHQGGTGEEQLLSRAKSLESLTEYEASLNSYKVLFQFGRNSLDHSGDATLETAYDIARVLDKG